MKGKANWRRRLQPAAGAAGAMFFGKVALRSTRPVESGAYEILHISLS